MNRIIHFSERIPDPSFPDRPRKDKTFCGRKRVIQNLGIISILLLGHLVLRAGDRRFKEIRCFPAPEARQGVAVDVDHIYVVGSQKIGKYDKMTGERVAEWMGDADGPILHLDSGVIVEGKLFCAHSNYPTIPMTSSIEIWDAGTMEHVGSHSFGIHWGSCTWVDLYNGTWWATFAQYDKWKHVTGKGTEWTTLVQFADHWQPLNAWIFPDTVIQRMRPMSNSGGSWGPDGLLYCTGHDHQEVYVLRIPKQGSVLELVEIVPLQVSGQGIAWDRTMPHMVYGIRKEGREVVQLQMISNE